MAQRVARVTWRNVPHWMALELQLKSSLGALLECREASQLVPRRGSPVIVAGMHRSGTSVTAMVLHELGVFMGQDQVRGQSESRFFMRENEIILRLASASWDEPEPLTRLLRESDWPRAFAGLVDRHLRGRRAGSYWGARGTSERFDDGGWGWKDPRNSLTLPVWLQLFPEARVVDVVRSADGVAQSLATRSRTEGRPLSTRTEEGCLRLRSLYLDAIDSGVRGLRDDRLLIVHYEDLIEDPEAQVRRLSQFCGVDSDQRVHAAIGHVRTGAASGTN